jgi:hypothetical protein
MTAPSDSADPRHYFRLLLQRLLETQKCLHPYVQNSSGPLALQAHANASTLSEIKSWLEASDGNWEITQSPSSARHAANSGHGSFPATETSPGGRPWPVVRPAHTVHQPGFLQAPSSPLSGPMRSDLVRTTTGRIIFLPKSSDGKPPST